MSLLQRIMARLRGATVQQGPSRADRPDHPEAAGDEQSTTGAGDSGTFVGRVSGEDSGYLESGADHRAQEEEPPEPR